MFDAEVDTRTLTASTRQSVVRLRNAEPAEAHSVGGGTFHQHRAISMDDGGEPRLTMDAFVTPSLTVGTLSYSRATRLETGAYEDWYEVNIVTRGSLRTSYGGEHIVAGRGVGAAYGCERATTLESWGHDDLVVGVKLSRDVVDTRFETLTGRLPLGPIRPELRFDLGAPAAREWLRLVAMLARQLRPDAEPLPPTMIAAVQDGVIGGFLYASRHQYSALLQEAPEVATRAARGAAARAVHLIHEDPRNIVGLESLARRVGITPRGLQLSFQREVGVSPMEYVKATRLARVRTALREADAREASVSELAARWGFNHLGRFAADYARRYGETPSTTLRRAS